MYRIAVLASRKAGWTAPPPKVASGYLARYASMVSSASSGRRPLGGGERPCLIKRDTLGPGMSGAEILVDALRKEG